MSETTTEKPVEQTSATTEAQTQEQAAEAKTFTQEDVNAIVRKRAEELLRQRVGEGVDIDDLKDKAAKYAEAQEAAKSEQERAREAAETAARERDEARAESLRYKAAATHGVDADNFDLLGSGSEEEIAARAERVGGLLKLQSENDQLKAEVEALRAGKPAPSTSRPVADLKPGATAEQITPPADDSYPAHWLPQR